MAPKKSPQKARAASSGGSEGDQTLAALAAGPLRKLPGERPRVLTEEQPLVRQVLPSYEDVDPEFSGDVSALRQSSEVKTIWKDHPIAKHQRSRYCWVAKAVVSRAGEAEAVFTTDADSMAQTPNWLEAKQNTCDVCGLCCKEVLYEFRCYLRAEHLAPGTAPSERRLEPFVSYMSQKCGSSLLGVRTHLAKVREWATKELLHTANPQEMEILLQEKVRCLAPADQRALVRQLLHLGGLDEGTKHPELQLAESHLGPLSAKAEDPFRALAHSLHLTARQLAALTALDLRRCKLLPKSGQLLERCMQCLEQQQPLPPESGTWPEVQEVLEAVVRAVPLHVELHELSNLGEPRVFSPKVSQNRKAKRVEDMRVKLMYLPASKSLHAAAQKTAPQDKSAAQLKKAVQSKLDAIPERWLLGQGGSFQGLCSGPRRGEDEKVQLPTEPCSFEQLLELTYRALRSITWPDCTSRRNVMQSGEKSIKAFCLGCIKPYFTPLTLSAKTRLLPRTTRLLTLLSETVGDPSFRYTSMQCNMNYSARLHVDKNNHGPSMIIGLGDYRGGSLWVMEEGGDYAMRVTEPLRGYPHLAVGQEIHGRLHDIHNKWFAFNGTVPHCALPFEGVRISIVFFTRSGAHQMCDGLVDALTDLGVRVPDSAWLAATAPETASASRPQKMPRLSEPLPPDDDSDDDEADLEAAELSTGRMDFDVFRQELQVPWHRLELPVGLTSCCPGVGAAYALQQLLPVAPTQVSLVHEGEVSDELCRLGKNLRVQECFKELPSSSALRHCEVRRRKEEMMPASAEHIFHAEFEVLPLMAYFFKTGLEQDKAVPARTLLAIQAHLRDRQPPVALVEVPDWAKLHGSQQRRALDFIREQISVPGYHFELVLAQLRDYGLPLTGCRLQAFMARTDCMGQEKLKQTAQLAKHLGSLLPKCRVQDFLLSESEELRELRAKWTSTGSKPQDGPYTEKLRDGAGASWFLSASNQEQKVLNQVWQQATRGQENASPFVIADMAASRRDPSWSDDGRLVGARSPLHYLFGEHRPLIGREEFLCRGYPAELPLRGLSDRQMRQLAAKSAPLPLLGAALAALLSMADFSHSSLASIPGYQHLAAQIGHLQLPQVDSVEQSLPPVAPEESVTQARAVVCYALLNRVLLPEKEARKPKIDPKLQEAIAKTSKEEEELIVEEKEELLLRRDPEDVFEDWDNRKLKLKQWSNFSLLPNFPKLPFLWVMRWTREAALEEPCELSLELLAHGLKYMLLCVDAREKLKPKLQPNEREEKLDESLTGLDAHHDALLQSLRDFQQLAEQPRRPLPEELLRHVRQAIVTFEGRCFAVLLRAGLEKKQPRWVMLGPQPFARHVREWVSQIFGKFLQLPASLSDLLSVQEHILSCWEALRIDPQAMDAFVDARGPQAITALIAKVLPGLRKQQGSYSPKPLQLFLKEPMLRSEPSFLREAFQLAFELKDSHTAREVEEVMLRNVHYQLMAKPPEEVLPLLRALSPMQLLGPRWQASVELLLASSRLKQQIAALRGSESESELTKLMQPLREAEARRNQSQQEILNRSARSVPKELWEQFALDEDSLTKEVGADILSRRDEARRQVQEQVQAAQREQRDQRKVQWRQQAETCLSELEKYLRQETRAGIEVTRLDDGRNFEAMKMAMQEFLKTREQCLQLGLEIGAERTMEGARQAARQFCEHEARQARAKERLLELGMTHSVVNILQQSGLFQRLPELSAELLQGVGLPPGVTETLLNAAQEGELSDEACAPVVPRGFTLQQSKSSSFYYLVDDSNPANTKWEWPAQDVPEQVQFPAQPRLEKHDDPHAKYISPARSEDGRWCYLCSCHANFEHLESGPHDRARRSWNQAANLMRRLSDEMSEMGTTDPRINKEDIARVWQLEAFQVLQPIDDWVLPYFWHLILEPWPTSAELRSRLAAAELAEPDLLRYPEVPRPGQDFPCFPRPCVDAESVSEDVNALKPMELLSQGLLLQQNGSYRCWYCDDTTDILANEVRYHLTHGKVARSHHKHRVAWDSYVEFLEEGWKAEVQGCHLQGKTYTCECGKTGDAWECEGHFQEKKHVAFLKNREVPQAVQARWKQRWEEEFQAKCAESLARTCERQRLADATRALFATPAGPAEASAPASAVQREEPPEDAEPPLPVPGKDFEDVSDGNMFQGNRCLCCYKDVPASDMRSHKETPSHGKQLKYVMHAIGLLQEHGDKLWREGMTLKDGVIKCSCGKECAWWEISRWFSEGSLHAETKQHQKWRRNEGWPPPPEMTWDAARRARWLACLKATSPPASREREEIPEPAVKRQRTEAPSSAASTETGASSSGSRPSVTRSMQRAVTEGVGPPTADEIKDAKENCENRRNYPPLPGDLQWGWSCFKKKTKEGWIWCSRCHVWVGVVSWDGSAKYTLSDAAGERGSCPHFSPEQLKRRYTGK